MDIKDLANGCTIVTETFMRYNYFYFYYVLYEGSNVRLLELGGGRIYAEYSDMESLQKDLTKGYITNCEGIQEHLIKILAADELEDILNDGLMRINLHNK